MGASDRSRVLVIEDRVTWHDALRVVFANQSLDPVFLQSVTPGFEEIAKERFDVVLLDLVLDKSAAPGAITDGFVVLRHLKARIPDVPVIVMTGYIGVEEAVFSMKLGAFDFVPKDAAFGTAIVTAIKEALEHSFPHRLRLDGENTPSPGSHSYAGMIGRSASMQKVFRTIQKAAQGDDPVLILGPTGTGKELVAKALHKTGKRQGAPFVQVNCGALSVSLAESELFGHEKGAFTGADKKRLGYFQQAQGGTLFLDEIGEMKPELQVKLLRAIEQKEFYPVGSDVPQSVDVRIMAATNRPIELISQGIGFREDLYYRLNGITLQLKPLRDLDRQQDIPLLARHFADLAAKDYGYPRPVRFSSETMGLLVQFYWPGNVRELSTLVRSAVIFSHGGPLTPEVIEGLAHPDTQGSYLKRCGPMKDVERENLLAALSICEQAKPAAARLLGISKQQFYRKLEEYGHHTPRSSMLSERDA